MSGLAGALAFDGQPVEPSLVGRMTAAMAHRGPDGIRQVEDGPAVLAHGMLCTTPESTHETQPLWDEARVCCLALDGRVDNRTELSSAIRAAGLTLRDDTDAELVLEAYMAFGDGCPARILGDFAFVVYDRREGSLFCARDPLGLKPLYYWTNERLFLWASELHALFQHAGVPREPNCGMAAEYLADEVTSLSETLWKDVLRLPRGHQLRVGASRRGVPQRYWNPDPHRVIRHRDHREYVERFTGIFREAVRCRLRSNAVVAADLSGGLDSSSVVGMAATLVREGRAAGPLQAVSVFYPGMPCDEATYIAAVERRWGIRTLGVSSSRAPSDFLRAAARFNDFPGYPEYDRAIVRNTGARVLLTGLGGDEWLDRTPVEPRLLRGLRGLSRVRSASDALRLLRRTRRAAPSVPPWIGKSFADRVGLADRVRPRPAAEDDGHFGSAARRHAFKLLTWGYQALSLETVERSASAAGIEIRHPFHDRRLIEFALALPDAQLSRKGQTKCMLRAVDDLLPDLVRTRNDKAEFSHDYAKVLCAPDARDLFADLRLAERGWVDAPTLSAFYREFAGAYEQGVEMLPHLWPLWVAFGIESWLRCGEPAAASR